MKPKHIQDDALEQMLKEKFKPAGSDWQSNRNILESILLQDTESVQKLKRNRWLSNAWIASFGMVAILILTFLFILRSDSPDKMPGSNGLFVKSRQVIPEVHYKTVSAKEKLIGMEDGGWKVLDEDQVSREYKYEYMDTVDLINEEDGSMMRIEVPRQEIVNVTYQVI